jgi:hypothetical protein
MNILVCACCFIFIIFEWWNLNVLLERLEISQRPASLIVKNAKYLAFIAFSPRRGTADGHNSTAHCHPATGRGNKLTGRRHFPTGRRDFPSGRLNLAIDNLNLARGRPIESKSPTETKKATRFRIAF